MTTKFAAIVGALVILVCLPPVKAVYESLITTYSGLFPNAFTAAFFTAIPYILLAVIIFGTIYKLFKGTSRGEL